MNNIDVINIIKTHKDFTLARPGESETHIKIAAVIDDSQVVYKVWNRGKHEWIYGIQPLSYFIALFNTNRLKVA